MRVLVISDTHRSCDNLNRVLEIEEPVDLLLHMGDVEGDQDKIRSMAGCHAEIIAGNNDIFSPLPRERELVLGDYRVWMTHGHRYGVHEGIGGLAQMARHYSYDIVMFGHTHRPVIAAEEGRLFLNPGSLTRPRQSCGRASYIMMEIDGGNISCDIRYLCEDGVEIQNECCFARNYYGMAAGSRR